MRSALLLLTFSLSRLNKGKKCFCFLLSLARYWKITSENNYFFHINILNLIQFDVIRNFQI